MLWAQERERTALNFTLRDNGVADVTFFPGTGSGIIRRLENLRNTGYFKKPSFRAWSRKSNLQRIAGPRRVSRRVLDGAGVLKLVPRGSDLDRIRTRKYLRVLADLLARGTKDGAWRFNPTGSRHRCEGTLKDPLEPDEELLEIARQAPEGDYQAFEWLVHRYQKKVVANCRYLTRNAAFAEDLAQEVFVKIFFARGRFAGRSSFRTWMQRIKCNHCLNFLKKQEGKTFLDVEDEQVINARQLTLEPSAEKVVMNHDQRELITAILDAMSDSLRIPLLMRDMDELSYQEVAETLGVGLSAVKMRIKRGREEFRRRYRELCGGVGLPAASRNRD